MDRDYIVKPFLINADLKKKKKQPKFVVEQAFEKVNYAEDLASDWLFMKTCRFGRQASGSYLIPEHLIPGHLIPDIQFPTSLKKNFLIPDI